MANRAFSTSGLDSSIAFSVMQVLRDIAATGRTVIATIHQPRSDIWKLADNITLLARGGVIAVSLERAFNPLGPDSFQFSGKRAEAVSYFTSIGHPVPSEFFNPADHLLDLVSVDPRPSNQPKSLERVHKLTSAWRARAGATDAGEETKGGEASLIKRGEGTSSMRVALPVVLERQWRNLWRRKDVGDSHERGLACLIDALDLLQSAGANTAARRNVYLLLPASHPWTLRYAPLNLS